MASDLVCCNGLSLEVRIGFHDHERRIRQRVLVDLAIETDFRKGTGSDRHEGLVNYYELARRLQGHVADREYDLLEAFAVDLARQVIAAHPDVRVRVRAEKRPFDMPSVVSVSVECTRTAADFMPQ
jgi:dihydroneopterin aldolase